LAALVVSWFRGPAFWLCGVGAVLLALVLLVQSQRTGEWSYLPWRSDQKSSLTPVEAFAGMVALILMAAPLVVVLLSSVMVRTGLWVDTFK
jgi:uncharacterized integral membrane protein